ncbi:MAG: glycine cleavage system protein GcvH [Betaproteobacteria bacterium]|nr:glycine cleavage system protein GcvH [Betaproteobacteria bacterium]
MTAPDNLKYAGTHEWARLEADGAVTVGITFHAQEQLGDVVFVQPPGVGRRVRQGEACAVIESVKAASDIHAPVSGEVIAANSEVAEKPERVNQDPYAAWLFRIRPDQPAEMGALLDAEAYLKSAEKEKT